MIQLKNDHMALNNNHTMRRLKGFYSATSLKQQSVGRHVAPLGHIIKNPIFALASQGCVVAEKQILVVYSLKHYNKERELYKC
jgi:hypothetical protein